MDIMGMVLGVHKIVTDKIDLKIIEKEFKILSTEY